MRDRVTLLNYRYSLENQATGCWAETLCGMLSFKGKGSGVEGGS